MTVQEATKALNEFYDFANERFFHIKAEKPQITIQSNGRTSVQGWFTADKVWTVDGGRYYEINICAEYLDLPITEIANIILHEMVHYKNKADGVYGCCRNSTYHNNHFKKTAETHGLNAGKIGYKGFAATSLNETGKQLLQDAIDADILPSETMSLRRGVRNCDNEECGDGERKSHIRKYVCKCVKPVIIRASKEVDVRCNKCNGNFVEKGNT